MKSSIEKLARVLRSDESSLLDLEKKLSGETGKKNVLDKISEENDRLIDDRLASLGLSRSISAIEVYDALISKIEADDFKLFEVLGCSGQSKEFGYQKVVELAEKFCFPAGGFFLKEETARRLLETEPPRMTMKALGYENIQEMLNKEDLFEIFSSLRFLEDSRWLNEVFFSQYEDLKPGDFEERKTKIILLGDKWVQAAQKFLKKKYHNVSHLKELGVIFVLSLDLNISGETLRLVSLLFHYIHEIKFYSDLFKSASLSGNFARGLISFLKGDILENLPETEKGKNRFLIVQRYLAKDDPNDHRLFVPHVNPEAMHWTKAEKWITEIREKMPGLENGFDFWRDLDWVGDFFKGERGIDLLVSFNLVDTVMSLVKQREMVKYLYHHQEALWNKIFIEYLGEEKLEEMVKKGMLRGYIEIIL